MAKVLLVEDDNNLREIYEARLQAEGYEIAAAQDGEQALVVAKDFKPDLVISDVMMPKISGFEMLDILRNTEGLEHTRVIMLTALSQAEDKSRADSLGADRYLVKSQVTLEDIIKAAHDILGDGTEPAAATPAAPAPVAATDVAVATPPEPTPDPAAVPAPAPAPQPTATPEPAAPSDVPVVSAPAEPTTIPVSEPAPVPEPAVADEPVQSNAAPTTAEDAIAQAVEVETAPATPPAVNPNQAKDDQLLADAESSLQKSTGTTASEPAEPAKAEAVEAPAPAPNPTDDSPAGSSKRVIQPISDDDGTKPTLEELLAREEAKDISTGAVAPTVSDAPAPANDEATPPPPPGTTTKPGQSADFNPHDISL